MTFFTIDVNFYDSNELRPTFLVSPHMFSQFFLFKKNNFHGQSEDFFISKKDKMCGLNGQFETELVSLKMRQAISKHPKL